jgi:hypothetical protein
VYKPLTQTKLSFECIWKGQWSNDIEVLKVKDISNKVAVWQMEHQKETHILRKHPGLAMLNVEETEQTDDVDVEDSRDKRQ